MEPVVDDLPYDVLENIFTRLPVKSAARCRCLSRSWASADFVQAYRRLANDDDDNGGPRFFFLQNRTEVTCRAVWTTTCTAYTWSLSRRPGDDEAPPLGVLPRNWGITARGCVTRPCHGLVVVEIRDENCRQVYYCVYNPSTCQLAPLPDRRLTGRCWSKSWMDNDCFTIYDTLGLGYDARSQKHKVVRVHYRGLPPDLETMKERKGLLPVVCEVYVVNDSTAGFWRAPAARGGAGAKVPAGWVSSYEPSVYAQGHVHWLAQKQKPKKRPPWRVTRKGLIVSFSLADEAFGVVPLPPRVDHLGAYRLTELKGRLCLYTHTVTIANRQYHDIWLLRDHEAGTWDLRCRIDLHKVSREVARSMCCAIPVATVDEGRRMLFMPGCDRRGLLCVYTPATGSVEYRPSGKGSPTYNHDYIYSYSQNWAILHGDSIASPGRPHDETIFSSTSMKALRVALVSVSPRDLALLRLVCRSWRAMVDLQPTFRESMKQQIKRRRYKHDKR